MDKRENVIRLFRAGYNCSQIVSSHFAENYGVQKEEAARLACGFGGGMRRGEVCGAVAGAIMVIGMKYGNGQSGDAAAKEICYKETAAFEEEFQKRKGSILCRDLLSCDLSCEDGREYARKHDLFATICPEMILCAIEILEERGY